MEEKRKQNNADAPSYKIWVDDGIVYIGYRNGVTLDTVIASEKEAMEIVSKQNKNVLPIIILCTNLNSQNVSIKVSEFSKLFSQVDFIKHVSDLWVVGIPEDLKGKANLVNKVFLAHRMHFPATLKQAQAEARAARVKSSTVLESENN